MHQEATVAASQALEVGKWLEGAGQGKAIPKHERWSVVYCLQCVYLGFMLIHSQRAATQMQGGRFKMRSGVQWQASAFGE